MKQTNEMKELEQFVGIFVLGCTLSGVGILFTILAGIIAAIVYYVVKYADLS